jgi:tetratricopeptide (TPR) repeat protein
MAGEGNIDRVDPDDQIELEASMGDGPVAERNVVNEPGRSAQAAPATEHRLTPETIVDRARSLAAQGRLEEAAELYRDAAIADPVNVDLRMTLGSIHDARGDYLAALEQYEHARAIDPESVEALLAIGTALAALSRFDAAERELRRAVKLDPTCAAGFATLGIVYFR